MHWGRERKLTEEKREARELNANNLFLAWETDCVGLHMAEDPNTWMNSTEVSGSAVPADVRIGTNRRKAQGHSFRFIQSIQPCLMVEWDKVDCRDWSDTASASRSSQSSSEKTQGNGHQYGPGSTANQALYMVWFWYRGWSTTRTWGGKTSQRRRDMGKGRFADRQKRGWGIWGGQTGSLASFINKSHQLFDSHKKPWTMWPGH